MKTRKRASKTLAAPPASVEPAAGQTASRPREQEIPAKPPASAGEAAAPSASRFLGQAAPAKPPAAVEKPAQPAAPQAGPGRPAGIAAAVPAAPEKVKVVFSTFQPRAKRVSVCGEFNDWAPEASLMEPQGNGRWQKVLSLKPGKYQYKFVVDGEWMPDPEAKQNVANAFGTLNSVVEAR
jgi:hypothetical protein